jgi:rhamnose transport system ATP-binding protein
VALDVAPASSGVGAAGGANSVASAPAFVRLEAISKSFGAGPVLRNVSLEFHAGEVHALVGENGAGKSTIAKITAGVISADAGTVEVGGNALQHASPFEFQRLGVSIIFQEPMLFPDLTVAENIYIGRQPRRKGRPWFDQRAMVAGAEVLLTQIGSPLPADRLVRGLSVAEMQMVEIAAAVSQETRMLIVDEPTASLTPTEVGRLFALLRSLCGRGTGVLFIGHRLEEVLDIADRITVLRDGEVVASRTASKWTKPELIEAMVGRKAEGTIKRQVTKATPEEVLRVDGLSRSGVFRDVSFSVHAGEVVGMAGLVGSGRSEIARAVFGIDLAGAGSVTVCGRKLPAGRPDVAIEAGLAYVPEDRKAEGLAERLPIYENVALLLRSTLGRFGWVRNAKEVAVAHAFFKRLDVRAVSVRQNVGELSGGNQQKVLLARWLATGPKVLILDEPTRGVDVGAKEEIHGLIDRLAADGLGILLISSDLPEVLALSDRILVVREGRVAGELARGCSAEEVLQLAVLSRASLELEEASA